jgi:hypothetical protein
LQLKPPSRRITGETLALLALGFSPFITVALWCEDCGFVRVDVSAIEAAPQEYSCPVCGAVRECGALQAIGFTRQALPRWDVVFGPVNQTFLEMSLGSYDEPARAAKTVDERHCAECGRLFVADHGNMKLCSDLCSVIRASRRAAKRYAEKTGAAVAGVTAEVLDLHLY